MATRIDPKRLEALLAIGALLAPKAKKVAAAVTQASRQPKAYLAAHRKRMDERDIETPIAALPWIALVDALEAAKVLVEIDWKTEADDLQWSIRKLTKGFRLPKYDGDADERSTWEMLELAGIELREQKLQLAQLDYDSDSYALVVVPLGKFAELATLAKRARYGKAEAFGDALAKATQERLARLEELARERKKPPPPPAEWILFARGDESWTMLRGAMRLVYNAPGANRQVNHDYSDKSENESAVERQIAQWKAEGFVELTAAEMAARPPPPRANLWWIGPFPDDGQYFLQKGAKTVWWIAVRGEEIVRTHGEIGRDFGQQENHYHGKAVADFYGVRVETYLDKKSYTPIDRAELIERYAKARKNKKS
jgi:hypothetical protein